MNTDNQTRATAMEVAKNYRKVQADYTYNPDIFNEEDERSRRVKWILDHKLSPVDRTILVLYAECQSYMELGKILKVHKCTAFREVSRIKTIIKTEFNKPELCYI